VDGATNAQAATAANYAWWPFRASGSLVRGAKGLHITRPSILVRFCAVKQPKVRQWNECHCLGWSRSHLTRSSTTRRHVRAQSFLVMCVSGAQSCMHCAYHSSPRLRICSGVSAPAGLYTAPGEFFFAVSEPVSNWAYPPFEPTSRTSEQTDTNNRMKLHP
jgi:hypothetical protein